MKSSICISCTVRCDQQLCPLEIWRVYRCQLDLDRPLSELGNSGNSPCFPDFSFCFTHNGPGLASGTPCGSLYTPTLDLLFIFHNRLLIIGGRLSFFKGNGPGGTGRQTVSKAVAIVLPEQFCFSFYHADSPLMTGISTKTAAVAFFFIYTNDPSLHTA